MPAFDVSAPAQLSAGFCIVLAIGGEGKINFSLWAPQLERLQGITPLSSVMQGTEIS